MKKLITLLALVITTITFAQAPQGFNYQATVRNSAGALIVNQNVNFKFNIMLNSSTSLPVFSETHMAPTDDLGQVNLVIGQGTATVGTFSTINWGNGNYYLGIELNTGSGYVAMGTTQLLSVPYALYANSSGNAQAAIPNLADVLAVNNGANNLQIKNLADPTDAQDAVTKAYTDLNSSPWIKNTTNDSISYDKRVYIGSSTNQFAPSLTVYGTDSGPTSPSAKFIRSRYRNNVLLFETSESDNNYQLSLGLLEGGENDSWPNCFSVGLYNGTTWKNPFRIYYDNNAIRLGYDNSHYSNGSLTGDHSMSLGYESFAAGNYATTLGSFTSALGNFSTAIGLNTTSNSLGETVVGMFNENYSPVGGTSGYSLQDNIFTVGNGTGSNSRSNALTIKKSGEISVEGNQIKNLADPTDAEDAVTKSYLENLLTNNESIPTGINNGDMLYWNNNNWTLVNHGTNGQILTFCNGVPTWTTNGICPPQVGDNYQGGIIIYINQPGDIGYVHGQTHGIIASIIDQTINSTSSYYPGETGCMWQPGTYDAQAQTSHFNVTNSAGIAVGTGSQNTNMILAVSQQTGMPFPAATLATQYTAGGYNDWILPSKDELRLLYQHRNIIGGFANGWYWSSTEMNDAYAEALDFSTGNFSGGYKGPGATPYKVRAVRYF
jgi:hypothetical protein